MLSEKDIKILDILKENCKLSTKDISKKTGIPITTIHNRIKKMEKEGVIKGYRAVVDNKRIGKGVQAFVQLSAKYISEELAKKLSMLPEVEEAHVVSGSNEVLIRISTSDMDDLNTFLTERLRSIKGIEKTTTYIVLKSIK